MWLAAAPSITPAKPPISKPPIFASTARGKITLLFPSLGPVLFDIFRCISFFHSAGFYCEYTALGKGLFHYRGSIVSSGGGNAGVALSPDPAKLDPVDPTDGFAAWKKFGPADDESEQVNSCDLIFNTI